MLPEGWQLKLLDSVAKRGSGHTPSKDTPEYWNGGVKWVSLADSWRLDRGLITETDKEISAAGLANSSAVLHPAGTVVLSRDAGVGKSAVLAEPMAVSQHFIAWDCSSSRDLYNWYLYHWLQAEKPEFERIAVGSTIKTIGLPYFMRMKVPLPPFNEQIRIADALSTWDRAIWKAQELHSKSRAQWQVLLGRCLRLPVANSEGPRGSDNGGFPPSVQAGIPQLPNAPDDWIQIPLGRHLSEVRRPVSLAPEETYRLVTVKRSRGGVDLRETLPGRRIKTPTQFRVHAGDFLISKRQIVHGACGIVPPELEGAIVSNEYAVLNTDGQIDLRFLRYLSESRYFQQTCFHSSIGVHVEKMIFKTERWLEWPFNIPPLPVQRRIVEVLDTARREIDIIGSQIDLLKQEKSALLANLLTGRRRVTLAVDREIE